MHTAAHPVPIDNPKGTVDQPPQQRDAGDFPCANLQMFVPILTRSGALLTLLLQDGIVDLELTSSVVALDPGLAFCTLQLANLEARGEAEVVWDFPSAVVGSGCDRLLQLLNRAPRVESSFARGTGAKLRQCCSRAVIRACVAELLAKRLGNGDPRQSYLAGLLFELPEILGMAGFAHSTPLRAALQAAMCGCLPAEVFTAITTAAQHPGKNTGGQDGANRGMAATVLLADSLLGAKQPEISQQEYLMERLAPGPLWTSGDPISVGERHRLLGDCCEMAKWSASNLPRLAPWEFTARLQRRKSWE